MSARILVAGVGNVFLGDDGFGVEVARRLADESFPDDVKVADFGIRGVHLAYELLEGYDTAILIDATPRGGEPGTVYVIEPEAGAGTGFAPLVKDGDSPLIDAHGMEPHAVLGMLEALGGSISRLRVVGCEPADVSERMGLSPPVEAAVDEAVAVVRQLVEEEASAHRTEQRATG